jgi:pullulanase/glycogen debranching enzyme
MIAFRKAHPALRVPAFYTGDAAAGEFPDLRWYGPNGAPAPDWDRGTAVACRIDGKKALAGAHAPFADDDDLFLAFNAGPEGVSFALPATKRGRPWTLAFRTDEAAVGGVARGALKLGPESLAVFVCKK